jgi:hypothetical protein
MRMDMEGRELDRLGLPDRMNLRATPLELLQGNLWVLGAASAWSREVFDRFGPIDEAAVVEDTVIPFRAAVLGQIGHVEEPLVRYRVGGISGSDAGRSVGWRKMYGERLRYIRFHIGSMRAVLADCERVDFPGREACARHCRRFIAHRTHQLEIAAKPRGHRFAALLPAIGTTMREQDPFYAYIAAKYAFDRVAIAAYNAKAWRPRRGGRPSL